MKQLIVAVIQTGYFGKGQSLEEAIQNARKAGASGIQRAVVYIYTGEETELMKIRVLDGGEIEYPQTVTSNRVGNVKLSMKQEIIKH